MDVRVVMLMLSMKNFVDEVKKVAGRFAIEVGIWKWR